MLIFERHRKIKEILQEYTHIDVMTLSSILNVSQVTIRKDLEQLEKDGVLTRIHGGALLNHGPLEKRSAEDNDSLIEEKAMIGKLATRLIDEGNIIFLGNGNTCIQIAKHIKGIRNISVITNNISIIEELFGCENINLFGIGGKVQKMKGGFYFYGSLSIEAISKLHFHKAFLSPTGVHIQHGYSVSNPEVLDLYNAVKSVSDKVIMVSDYSKFDKVSMVQFSSLKDMKTLVTNENIPMKYKEFFFNTGVELYTTISSDIQDS